MTLPNTKRCYAAQSHNPAIDVDPHGGIDRLRAAGIIRTDGEVEMLRATRRNPTDHVPFFVWPVGRRREERWPGKSLIVVGRCPHCGFVHDGHGYPVALTPCAIDGRQLVRVPPCYDTLHPRRDGKREEYRLVLVLDTLPDDLALERRRQRGGIVKHFAKAISAADWAEDDSAFALALILRSGACDERAAILEIEGFLSRPIARRRAAAEFLSKFGGEGSERECCARAMLAAMKGAE